MRTRSKFPSCEKSKLAVEICRRKLYNIFGVTLIHVSRQGGKAMSVKQMIQFGLVLVLLVATFAAASNADAWSSCGSTYVVQRGDWLAKVAGRWGISLFSLYARHHWGR